VSEAGNRVGMLSCLEKTPINLITLDLDLGGHDGLDLAREVRAKRNVPIIMITGKSGPLDRVAGLEKGADDYITKPFHIREVLIRIRTILRRYEPESSSSEDWVHAQGGDERYEFEGAILSSSTRALKASDGVTIDLTGMEFDLLLAFLRRPARVLTRDELMNLLKGQSWSPMDRTIDGHIARLRSKIEPRDSEAPRLIKSVRGVGYVFAAKVKRL